MSPSLSYRFYCLNASDISRDEPYIPPTKPYELSELVIDLILLSRYLLKPHGLLVFFLPTVTDSYEEVDIKSSLCEGMVLVANSLQDFGSWGRRVRTSSLLQKITLIWSRLAHYHPKGDLRQLSASSI